MNFEETTYENEGMMTVQIAGTPMKFRVTKNAVPGYIFQDLGEFDRFTPMTAAHKAFGSLWYGNMKPDLVLSSEAEMKRMVRCLIPDQRKPVMYGCNFGFFFNGAVWSHPEGLGFDIDDGWVFMLNTKEPLNLRLNGCYRLAG